MNEYFHTAPARDRVPETVGWIAIIAMAGALLINDLASRGHFIVAAAYALFIVALLIAIAIGITSANNP